METLNLSDSTPRSDGRLKSLFWPSIQSGTDVDYLGVQGYWVFSLIGVISPVFLVSLTMPIAAAAVFFLYYIGGVGVRERSPFAAAMVFVAMLAEIVTSGPSVLRVILTALLLSN